MWHPTNDPPWPGTPKGGTYKGCEGGGGVRGWDTRTTIPCVPATTWLEQKHRKPLHATLCHFIIQRLPHRHGTPRVSAQGGSAARNYRPHPSLPQMCLEGTSRWANKRTATGPEPRPLSLESLAPACLPELGPPWKCPTAGLTRGAPF